MTDPTRSRKALGAIALLAGAGLAACGGGGGGSTAQAGGGAAPATMSDTVPATAAVSTDALVGYSQSLSADDTAEPMRVNGFAPPTDDTAEPKSLR